MQRPIPYGDTVAGELCARLAEGRSLRSICDDADMPARSTVFLWLGRHADFARSYAAARTAQADGLFDEILAIADEAEESGGAVAKAKLRIDTRKWWLSKVAPKTYGERPGMESDGAPQMTPEERQARIKVLLDKAVQAC